MAIELLMDSLPEHWEVLTLGEACCRTGGDVQTGPFGSQLHASDYVPVGVPSIMPKNIGDNRINTDDIARITPQDAERLSRYRVRTGDIVYSRRGDVERRALVRESEHGWLCGTGCLRVRFGNGKVDPAYASFYLGHPSVREWIVRHAHGATMPNLNTSILSALPFVVPPINEQRRIAATLSAFDDKIELNRRMNETLEAMARAIFKSWFVDFDPVRAKVEGRQPKGIPAHIADLFPNQLTDSPLGPIPKGWEVGTLGDIGENPRRIIRVDEFDDVTPYIGLEHMPRGSISLGEWGTTEGLGSNKYRFETGEVLFGKLRPYFHKVGIAPLAGVCSTDVLVLTPKSATWSGFLLGHVSSAALIAYVTAASSGTRMPRTNWKDVSEYEVVIPNREVARAYGQVIAPMLDLIQSNIHESKTLTATREVLLPDLIGGRRLATT